MLSITIFCLLPLLSLVFFTLAQVLGGNPVRVLLVQPITAISQPNPVHWESIAETGLVMFILLPVLILLYVLAVGFSGAMWLVNIGMVLGGVLFLLTSLDNLDICVRFKASEQWATTWGRMYSDQEDYPLIDAAEQVYMYTVNGKEYIGSRIDAHNRRHRPLVRRPYRNYKHIEQVLVYYHPTNPEISLLVPGINWSSVAVFMGCGVTFLMVPLFFSVF